jgi:hypothetical protein
MKTLLYTIIGALLICCWAQREQIQGLRAEKQPSQAIVTDGSGKSKHAEEYAQNTGCVVAGDGAIANTGSMSNVTVTVDGKPKEVGHER